VKEEISKVESLIWVFCLACLSVGARNFEQGISLDGPLYATIARNIVRHHEWFLLQGDVPDFQPYFAEHPHLGFWILAVFFKLFSFASWGDWVARSVGHVFYIAFLWMFFLNVRKLSDERVAVLSVLLLWSWYQFSNTFSNVYLDPGTLFFGTASVFLISKSLVDETVPYAMLSGLSLALCALYKGLTFLGFLPVGAWLFINSPSSEKGKAAAISTGVFAAVVGVYVLLVLKSHVPDFFTVYWGRQMTHRFSAGWQIKNLFQAGYWKELMRYSYFLAPLALVPIFRKPRYFAVPAVLLFTFVMMFAPARLWGGQYLLMVLPWLAWLIAGNLPPSFKPPIRRIVYGTGAFAMFGVFVLQYLPVTIHRGGVSPLKETVNGLSRRKITRRLYIESPGFSPQFLAGSSYAWYGDVIVEYVSASQLPPADSKTALAGPGDGSWDGRLGHLGWCKFKNFEEGSLWLSCERTKQGLGSF
jgi:hypothetical protein